MQQSQPTTDDLEALIRNDLVQLDRPVQLLAVVVDEAMHWQAHLVIKKRIFEMGCNVRGNLYCWEHTPEKIRHLISPDDPPVAGDTLDAVRMAVGQVKYTLLDPGFFVVGPAVI